MRGSRPVVFLDRDGVLNRTTVRAGVTHPPHSLAELELLPGVPAALNQLAGAGFALVVVTNQPDVARGVQVRERVEEMHAHLLATLPLLGVMVCYHDGPDNCECRKPKPGMLLAAAEQWQLDLSRGYLVGDRWSDIRAGQAARCRSLLVETPYSGREKCCPDALVANLPEAAAWILHMSALWDRRPKMYQVLSRLPELPQRCA